MQADSIFIPSSPQGGTLPSTVTVDNFPSPQTITGSVQVVPTIVAPFFSTLNSSNVQLGANGIYLGDAEDVSEYVSLDVSILSDQSSATQGVLFEFSQDGVVWNFPLTFTTIANTGQYFSLAPRARYFRASYTNGTTPTTTFNISAIYYGVTRSMYQINVDDNVIAGQAADTVKAVLCAKQVGSSPSKFLNLSCEGANNALIVDASTTTQSIIGTVAIDNFPSIQVVATTPAAVTITDRSATIGTSSQQILASNSNRKYLLIQNQTTARIWMDFSEAAVMGTPSIRLSPGMSYEMEDTSISTDAIYAISDKANIYLTIKEG